MASEQILIIDDELGVRAYLSEILKGEGYQVIEASTGEEGVSLFRKKLPETVICDLQLPRADGLTVLRQIHEIDKDTPVIVLTGHGTIESAIQAMRLGAFHYITKPMDPQELLLNVQKALESRSLRKEVHWLRKETRSRVGYSDLIGSTPETLELVKLVEKVAGSDAPTVLLQGESGTGKNLVARMIHFKSRRSRAPFVEINCASLPDTLIESELFGHEKGSFTDAKQLKRGLFEVARGGTIFLDEIGEISSSTQAKLLQAIEEHTFRRVGGIEDVNSDARVIASTNINLKEAVAQKKFRDDLYFRLSLIPIRIPALRERSSDIPLLTQNFINTFNREYRKTLKGVTPEAEALLKAYSWPGNVRELKNVIERIVILESEEWIGPSQLPAELRSGTPIEIGEYPLPGPSGRTLEDVEKQFIVQALHKAEGNQSHAARLLGITRHTLRYRMEKFGLLDPSNSH